MENSGHVSLSGQSTLRRELSIIANNLANVNTNGFRAERLAFAEYLSKTPNGDRISFVQGLTTVRDLSEGQKIRTGGDLDLAIEGSAYFQIENPDGGRFFTRNGALSLNEGGELVTREGNKVLGEGDVPIELIGASGQITVNQDGTLSSENGPLGRIKVVTFENEARLAKLPGGLYDSDGQEPLPAEDFRIHQGFLEGSNVVGIAEMTRMMDVVRSYSSATKLVEEEHRRQEKAIDVLGGRAI